MDAIRTANHAWIKHAHLTLRNFTARNCSEPFRISHTNHVLAEDLSIVNEPAAEDSPIRLQKVQDAVIRRVTVQGLRNGVDLVKACNESDFALEKVTRGNSNVGSGK